MDQEPPDPLEALRRGLASLERHFSTAEGALGPELLIRPVVDGVPIVTSISEVQRAVEQVRIKFLPTERPREGHDTPEHRAAYRAGELILAALADVRRAAAALPAEPDKDGRKKQKAPRASKRRRQPKSGAAPPAEGL